MNAPAGATAAAYGSNVTENTTNNSTTNINSNNIENITNNLNVNAKSGNADVSKNTNAGNATSGNANAAVNILNLEGSSFNASGWFGILFINVFGNWKGSFGVLLPLAAVAPPTLGGSNGSPSNSLANNINAAFTKSAGSGGGSSAGIGTLNSDQQANNSLQLVSAKLAHPATTQHSSVAKTVASNERRDSLMIGGVMVLFGIGLFVTARRLPRRTILSATTKATTNIIRPTTLKR